MEWGRTLKEREKMTDKLGYQGDDEIDITPEMINAGLDAMMGEISEWEFHLHSARVAAVTEIYRAMVKVSRRKKSSLLLETVVRESNPETEERFGITTEGDK
jgi:hypothetical protein